MCIHVRMSDKSEQCVLYELSCIVCVRAYAEFTSVDFLLMFLWPPQSTEILYH